MSSLLRCGAFVDVLLAETAVDGDGATATSATASTAIIRRDICHSSSQSAVR